VKMALWFWDEVNQLEFKQFQYRGEWWYFPPSGWCWNNYGGVTQRWR